MSSNEIANTIYEGLFSRRFTEWHDREFEDHITGDDVIEGKFKSFEESKAETIEQIKKIFKLK